MLIEKEIQLVNIVKEAAKYGISMEAHSAHGLLSIRAYGFSKSGSVEIYIENNEIVVEARYQEKTVIETFDDLARIAFDWWERYKERSPFEQPNAYWLKYFLEKEWVKEVKTVKYV